jgi:sporulation protein YlmC with PRC-barrel domain
MKYCTPSGSRKAAPQQPMSSIAASSVIGTDVYNAAGDVLGSIHDVMLDKCSGQVEHAVMSFGGFRGMGENYHPVPWNQLSYSEEYGGYIVQLDASPLPSAPNVSLSEARDWSSPSYRRSIDEYLYHAQRVS